MVAELPVVSALSWMLSARTQAWHRHSSVPWGMWQEDLRRRLSGQETSSSLRRFFSSCSRPQVGCCRTRSATAKRSYSFLGRCGMAAELPVVSSLSWMPSARTQAWHRHSSVPWGMWQVGLRRRLSGQETSSSPRRCFSSCSRQQVGCCRTRAATAKRSYSFLGRCGMAAELPRLCLTAAWSDRQGAQPADVAAPHNAAAELPDCTRATVRL